MPPLKTSPELREPAHELKPGRRPSTAVERTVLQLEQAGDSYMAREFRNGYRISAVSKALPGQAQVTCYINDSVLQPKSAPRFQICHFRTPVPRVDAAFRQRTVRDQF